MVPVYILGHGTRGTEMARVHVLDNGAAEIRKSKYGRGYMVYHGNKMEFDGRYDFSRCNGSFSTIAEAKAWFEVNKVPFIPLPWNDAAQAIYDNHDN
jgi:hypothetical protein